MEARLGAYRARVRDVLEAALPGAERIPRRLHAAQRYAVLGGGKRLRPLLVYCTGEALGIPASALDAPAAAGERMHTYSWAHDDLPAMDDEQLRRGQPTTHRAFDEATAILAGDALQVLAFSLLARDRAPEVSAESRIRMIRILADASGTEGMAGGQAIDLSAVGRKLDLAELEAMHRLKTGALIRASVLMAAACSPLVSEEKWQALDHYSQDIGLAFQIQDDVLDVEGNVEIVGKTIGADAARAKPTYPSILGLEAAKIRARDLHFRACAHLAALGPEANVLAWLAAYVIERQA